MKRIIIPVICLTALAGCSAETKPAMSSETVSDITVTETASAAESEITTSETASAVTEPETAEKTTTVSVISETVFTDDFDYEPVYELLETESISVTDLNGDGRREKIYCFNPYGSCSITYYDSADQKQTIEFWVQSVWGGTWYLESTKQIVNVCFFGHTDGTGTGFEMNVYDFSGNDITLVHSYYAEGGWVNPQDDSGPSDMTYKLDDTEISSEEVIPKLKELSELFEEELGYPLFVPDERNTDNYIIYYPLTSELPCNLPKE